eukprot:XP_001704292.1 Hypothetical protein GL50803_103206 [Giardia lamblia ATCC 50803]
MCDIDIACKRLGSNQVFSVDPQNLLSSSAVGKTNLQVHFKAAGTHQSLVQKLFPVGHTNHKHVTKRVGPVHHRK